MKKIIISVIAIVSLSSCQRPKTESQLKSTKQIVIDLPTLLEKAN